MIFTSRKKYQNCLILLSVASGSQFGILFRFIVDFYNGTYTLYTVYIPCTYTISLKKGKENVDKCLKG